MLGGLEATTAARFLVVFDGSETGIGLPPESRVRSVQVRFTDPGVEADDVVLDIIESTPTTRPVVVVSSYRRGPSRPRPEGQGKHTPGRGPPPPARTTPPAPRPPPRPPHSSPPPAAGRARTPPPPRRNESGAPSPAAPPPRPLSADAWRAVMAGLDRHFGADASLEPAARDDILAFLERNAGRRDTSAGGRPLLRVTQTRWFVKEHRDEVPAEVLRRPDVKSFANCGACHPGADRGVYAERDIRIPGGRPR